MASSDQVADTTNTNTDPTFQTPVIDTENLYTRSEEKRLSALVEGYSCLCMITNSSKQDILTLYPV